MNGRDHSASWSKPEGGADWSKVVQIYPVGKRSIGSDNKPGQSHTKRMNDITREELDAKLQATEARMDARLERFDKDMRQAVSDFRLEVQPLKSLKANIWGATAVTIGVMVAVLSYGVASFDSGRDTSVVIQEMRQQSFETRQLLEQIKSQQAGKSAEASAPDTPLAGPQK